MNHVAPQSQFVSSAIGTEENLDGVANIEAEQALLGGVLLNNDAMEVLSFLEPEHFYEPIHRRMFASMRAKIAAGRRADVLILAAEFGSENLGSLTGRQYLSRLAAEAAPVVHARDYGLAILEAFATKKAVIASDDFRRHILERGFDETITGIVSEMEDELAEIRALAPSNDTSSTISGAVNRVLNKIGEKRPAAAHAIPFPLPELGMVLQENGFQPGNLYGLLGSSGEGKTSLMLQITRAAIDAGHPVLIMSYDQTEDQILQQMVSQAVGIPVSQMNQNNPGVRETINHIEYTQIENASHEIASLAPLAVRSLTDHKIGGIVSLAKRWAKAVGKMVQGDGAPWRSPLIILDHNRKVRADDPRADAGTKAAAVNGAGKALARQLGAAVLFLNQRNGRGNDRYVPRPIAEDLFGGEQAKEDYDSIFYIYRPERWRDEQMSVARDATEAGKIRARFMLRKSWEDTPIDPENMAEIGAIKTRYGKGGVKEFVRFEGRYTRYVSQLPTARELFQ